jgi:UDP-N-acetylglucosamine/UDP-N-acetylgalactosamine diphosphorylase
MFPVGPVTGKSLFQIHTEKVLALRRRYQAPLPFLVMTSPATDQKTRAYFAENRFFGLPPAEVHFFCQGTMPAVDLASGKLLMAAPHQLATSPNGHGGTLRALQESGLLERLERDGIRHLFYFQVDNPLVKVADPVFLGHHLETRAELSLKVIPKLGPTDKLGNLVEIDGRCAIIEYSDLPEELANARDEHGGLRYWIGSPAIHFFEVDFLRRVLNDRTSLPFHLARKKVPYVNETGQRIEPAEPNALKFEMFIFDVLPHAQRWTAVLTKRDEEFAPLKNDTGPDSPETVRQALSEQAARWLRQAGVEVPSDADGEPPLLEISPLYALGPDDLAKSVRADLHIAGPTYLG